MKKPHHVIDLKSSTSEQDRLQTDIFESTDQHAFEPPDEETLSDDDDASSVQSLDYIKDLGPPGKRRKLRDARSRPDIWNRRFQNPLRQANIEQFKAKVNAYEEQGFTLILLPMINCLISVKDSDKSMPNF